MSVNAQTSSGESFVATNNEQGDARSVSLQSNDAGAILRFFDFYDKMRGGKITVGLAGQGNGPLSGQIDARNFSIINEPRLAKLFLLRHQQVAQASIRPLNVISTYPVSM